MRFVMAQCEFIVVLDQGRVLCTGSPDEIRANKDVQTASWVTSAACTTRQTQKRKSVTKQQQEGRGNDV